MIIIIIITVIIIIIMITINVNLHARGSQESGLSDLLTPTSFRHLN